MSKSGVMNDYVSISGRSIELFGLPGSPEGESWVIGVPVGEREQGYLNIMVAPAPSRSDVLDIIHSDEDAGKYDLIRTIMVSSRVAVRLWLDGTLKREHFAELLVGYDPEGFEYIELPLFEIGNYRFPLLIASEFDVGSGFIATLDEDGEIV